MKRPIASVEHIPLHTEFGGTSRKVSFDRLPVVGELVYTDDSVFVVQQVLHPLDDGDLPIVRVVRT